MAIQYIYFVDTENIPLDTIKGYNMNKKGGMFIIICNNQNIDNVMLKCNEYASQYSNFQYKIFEVPVGVKDSLDIQLAYLVGYYTRLYQKLIRITILSRDKIYYPLKNVAEYLGVSTSFPLMAEYSKESLDINLKGSFSKVCESRKQIKM